jgi:hypothetical protein
VGLRERIKFFKDWCPQPPDRLPTKQKSYSLPIVVVVAASLIFGVSLLLLSSQYTLNQTVPKVPIINTQSDNSSQLLPSPTSTPQITQKKSLITEEQAINVAMPSINQYAKENNRTIAVVDATFYELNNVGPVWDVFGAYQRANVSNEKSWVIGYKVTVYAESGKIYEAQANADM